MKIFIWLKCLLTGRGNAMLLYRRGMTRARKHDHQGAIEAYTAAIDLPAVLLDVKAMALYNRALVHIAAGDKRKGVGDLEAVLAIEEGPVNVRTMARQKLLRMEARASSSHG